MASPARLATHGSTEKALAAQEIVAEHSFKDAEQWRQKTGFNFLKRLLALGNSAVNTILKDISIPEKFDIEKDWLEPTAIHEFGTQQGDKLFIKGPGKEMIQVMGVRIRDNVVTRSFTERQITEAGLISPDGGGVRVTFVEAEEQKNGHKECTIAHYAKAKEKMFNEARGLAGAMVPKNTSLEFRERLIEVLKEMNPPNLSELLEIANKIFIGGGAKGDIIVALPPEIVELERKGGDSVIRAKDMKKELVCRALFAAGYKLAEQGAYNPYTGRYAGDKNTTGTVGGRSEMEWLSDGAISFFNDQGKVVDQTFLRAGVSGKTIDGLTSRFYATGLGGAESTRAFARLNSMDNSMDLKGKRLMSRGVGSAVNRGLIEMAKDEVIVECIADASGIIIKKGGFTPEEIEALYDLSVEQGASIVSWAKNNGQIQVYYEPPTFLTEEERFEQIADHVNKFWKDEKPEIIYDAVGQEMITEKNADFVPDGALIVEFGNGVTTPKAAKILDRKNVERIPGINCNGAGVFVSWFEWAQSILKVQFPPELIDKAVAKMMEDNMRETFELISAARESGIRSHQESAFYALAFAKGLAERKRLEERMAQTN